MRVTVLGSGASAGVPMLGGAGGFGDWGVCDPAEPRNRRSRASIVIEDAGGALLVDTAPELRTQLVAAGIGRIDAVVYTHAHADHVMGLDDLRALNRIANRPLEAFGTRETMQELTTRFPYAFKPWTPPGFFRPVLESRLVEPGQIIDPAGFSVLLFEQDHKVCKTLGLRAGRFGYSTDVLFLNETAMAALAGVDTWVVGCFQRASHWVHANLDQVLAWVERLRPRRTVLTHLGTDMDYGWMTRNLPSRVEPGYDGMVLEIPV
ncbi:MAG: MBL fold metallo-hydrolase [Rhodospirillales bacterium]|nr:MBL fold metallo-hydrolase [Rhodospirillales bacterium]